MINIMAVNDLEMQGTRATAATMFTMLNGIKPVPHVKG